MSPPRKENQIAQDVLVLPRYQVGGKWKSSRQHTPSQTPGKLKGESCKTNPMKSFFAKRGCSYKHPGYSDWCRQMDALNQSRMASG